MKNVFLILFFLAFGNIGFTAIFITTSDGNWTANSTWVGNNKPGNWFGAGDTVIVQHQINLNQNIGFQGVMVIQNGASLEGNRNIQLNGSALLTNNGNLDVNQLSLNSDTKVLNNGKTITNSNLTLNGNADFISNGPLEVNGALTNGGDSLILHQLATINGNIQNNGGVILVIDSLISTSGNLTNNSGGSIVIPSNGYLSINGNITNNSNSSIINDGYVNAGNNITNNSSASPGILSNGDMMVGNSFTNNNGTVSFGQGSQLNVNNNFTNNANVSFGGTAYINNNFTHNSGALTVESTALIQINNELTSYGNITLNGSMAVANGGVNTSSIIGNGLLQIDNGFTNWGSIGGTLDVCSSDAASNPISQGNNVSGGATVCSNSGVNFPLTPFAPLPVNLVAFDAKLNSIGTVTVQWVTSSEINSHYFLLEKADENLNFKQVKKVDAAGNSTSQNFYEVTDETPFSGVNYYKLTQVDFDGKQTTFSIIQVNGKVQENLNNQLVEVYPNPLVGNELTIKLPALADDEVNLFIRDLYGNSLVTDITFIELEKQSLVMLKLSDNISSGTYILGLVHRNSIITKKIIVP